MSYPNQISMEADSSQTTLIITSDEAATNIHAQISGSFQSPSSSIWYIPCTASYPFEQNVFFTIDGRRFGVPIEDLAWKVSDEYAGLCISGVQASRASTMPRSPDLTRGT